MRAVVHDRYGPPKLLRVAKVERPAPGEIEILRQPSAGAALEDLPIALHHGTQPLTESLVLPLALDVPGDRSLSTNSRAWYFLRRNLPRAKR